MIHLRLAADLSALLRIGTLTCETQAAPVPSVDLDAAIRQACDVARATSPDVTVARALYKAIGLDPTRTRPSSEALLRRVKKGDDLPRVNVLVDIGNWCSLDAQLPYGLYDADRFAPPIVLKLGGPGDAYPGIRKDQVHLEGRFALFDEAGPFGNPSSDSARTMVTAETRRMWCVVYTPASVEVTRMAQVLDRTAERFARYAGAIEMSRQVC